MGFHKTSCYKRHRQSSVLFFRVCLTLSYFYSATRKVSLNLREPPDEFLIPSYRTRTEQS